MRSWKFLPAAVIAAVVATIGPAVGSAAPPLVDMLAPGYPTASFTPTGAKSADCTAGFVVRNANDAPILMMAGHCDRGGSVAFPSRSAGGWQPVGTFLVNTYEPPFSLSLPDMGVVPVAASVPVSTKLLGRTPIAGAARPRVGERLCKVGSFSGTT